MPRIYIVRLTPIRKFMVCLGNAYSMIDTCIRFSPSDRPDRPHHSDNLAL